MDLLEYQAKEWFREMGIPVLPSQRIDRPSDLKGLKIRYPVVLKSQVRVGGRGRAGGVKFVENTIDAIAAAQTIFYLPILGELPEVLLAEAKYNAEREIYLAVVLDASVRRPVLLGSPQGGIDVELVVEQMQRVVVEQEFSPFYARRLAVKMGLQGDLIQSVSNIVERMYQLFVHKDLDLVEINPLGVSSNGEVMALDGKVTVNDAAIGRHSDIALLATKIARGARVEQTIGEIGTEALAMHDSGNVGIVGNGVGLVLATVDLISQAGLEPATCLNIGHEHICNGLPSNLGTRLEQSLKFLSRDQGIQVILVNVLDSASRAMEVAEVVAAFVQCQENFDHNKTTDAAHLPHIVVRLASSESDKARECLKSLSVLVVEDLDEAVAQALRLVNSASS